KSRTTAHESRTTDRRVMGDSADRKGGTMNRTLLVCVALALTGCNSTSPQVGKQGSALVGANPRFTTFESGQVRPLALSPKGKRLYAVNTPDDRLEIFDVTKTGLKRRASVTVGMEPVSVAARSNDEVWVVNHLSDSVSIVDVSELDNLRVTRTLLVGDEPRDI